MLRSLHVRNYVLIDSLDTDFPEGLLIITGQTGAGKSILLGALSLLTGAKADASVISEGADNCVVEGEFFLEDAPEEVRTLLDEAGVEFTDGTLLVRRVVYSTGRSRSFVNDSPVQVQLLSDLAAHLVDIHSQHQSLVLTSRAFQLSLLDNFAGLTQLRGESSEAWHKVLSLKSELAQARERLARISAESDYSRSQFEQLDRAALREGELEELEEEQKQLANAEEIRENLSGALSLLDPSDSVAPGPAEAMREAVRLLEKTAKYVPSLSQLGERLTSARIELEDICGEIDSTASSVVLSRERLDEVEARISLIYQLLRKHDVRTVGELIAVRDRYSEELFDGTSLAEKVSVLDAALSDAQADYDALCLRLHEGRLAAAPALASEIQASIRGLELDRALFVADVLDAAPGAYGTDSVMFRFSATGTTAPADLAKCASGGEISRIMLCLKAMMARFTGMPTMIFDEIDTGVSGSAAHKMGALICEMGHDMQVMAITHLPQVAAKGSAHYVVEKSDDASGRTVSTIREVRGSDRVREIARLLSGATITPAALANARALLGES